MKVVFVDHVKTSTELGRANMIAIPRVGELVDLEMSCPCNSRDPLLFAHFVVKQIEYDAKNTLQVEEWMHPYEPTSERGMVIVHVDIADDKATREYVYRVLGYAKPGESEDRP